MVVPNDLVDRIPDVAVILFFAVLPRSFCNDLSTYGQRTISKHQVRLIISQSNFLAGMIPSMRQASQYS